MGMPRRIGAFLTVTVIPVRRNPRVTNNNEQRTTNNYGRLEGAAGWTAPAEVILRLAEVSVLSG